MKAGRYNYMATLCHEFSHWTMHEKRLNRDVDFKCKKSIAELSNSILLKHFGISAEVQNHASYIESWMTDLTVSFPQMCVTFDNL